MPTLHLSSYISNLHESIKAKDAKSLAPSFALYPPNRNPNATWHGPLLLAFLDRPDRGQNRQDRALMPEGTPYVPSYAAQFARTLKKEWADMATNHVWALVALYPPVDVASGTYYVAPDPVRAYKKQHEVATSLYKYLIDSKDVNTGWALDLLYRVCQDLRRVAEEADQTLMARGEKPGKLEEASRLLQKCFACCVNDRSQSADVESTRKMGTYYLASLLFKTYFKLNSTALCKNIIRGITSQSVPELDVFPNGHRITYMYYLGVFAFLREDYADAEQKFVFALEGIHKKATRNIDLILDYLIPIMLLRGVVPSDKLLRRPSSSHRALYGPFVDAIRTGNVKAYDRQLDRAEKRLMERGTYLVVERAREVCVRGLLKKAWILESKPSRIHIDTFRRYYNAALRVEEAPTSTSTSTSNGKQNGRRPDGDEVFDSEEMECLLANCINKGVIKGYISHDHQMVVLSKERPFPWYPPYRRLSPADQKAREEREIAERKREVVLPPGQTTQPTANGTGSQA
ncbi:hypothetical protein JCM10212_001783 [Sporobolomyces blumeae]